MGLVPLGGNPMYLEIFAKRLKDLMEMEEESNRALSIKINVARKSVRGWLTGKFFPKYNALIKLSAHFKVSVDYLVGLEDVMDGNGHFSEDIEISKADISKNLTSLLNEYMSNHNKTHYAMAKSLDIDQKAFSKWFKNGSVPEVITLIKISRLMTVPMYTLLGGKEQ